MLDHEQGQAEPEEVLNGDVHADVDDGDDQGSRAAAGQDRVGDEPQQRTGNDDRDHPPHEATRCSVRSGDVAVQEQGEKAVGCRKHSNADGRDRTHHAEEVRLVDSHDELGVVVETDKLEIDAPFRKTEP